MSNLCDDEIFEDILSGSPKHRADAWRTIERYSEETGCLLVRIVNFCRPRDKARAWKALHNNCALTHENLADIIIDSNAPKYQKLAWEILVSRFNASAVCSQMSRIASRGPAGYADNAFKQLIELEGENPCELYLLVYKGDNAGTLAWNFLKEKGFLVKNKEFVRSVLTCGPSKFRAEAQNLLDAE